MGSTNLAQKRSEPMCFFETYITCECECECASRQNGNRKYKQRLKPKLYYPHLVKRQIEQTKSSLGPKEKSVVPEPLFEHHTFATPVREILQLPKTREESSPSDETPGKTMKTGTTEEWKKVVPKSRRKASPISKKKTGPYPIILNKTGQKQKITVKRENI